MNIEKTKLKKIILTILLLFAAMLIVPVFISSLATKVNGYSFNSISGKTWSTSEDCAELYEFLYQIKADGGTLPDYRN